MSDLPTNWYSDDDSWHYQSVLQTPGGRKVHFCTARDWRGALVTTAESIAPEGRYARAWIESDRWIGREACSIPQAEVKEQHEALACWRRGEVLADIEAYFTRLGASASKV